MTQEQKESTTQERPSWIESFVELTSYIPAPKNFLKWTAISLIASALERRVFVVTRGSPLYPNLYTLLVGRPGVGKSQAIVQGTNMMTEAKDFNVAPKDLTRASLIDYLAEEKVRRRILLNNDFHIEYHSALLAVSEFGVLLKEHDTALLNLFNDIYDNPSHHQERRRHSKDKPIHIPNPQITLLAGTTPGFIATTFPAEAWSQGFMARMILIYSSEIVKADLFSSPPFDTKLQHKLANTLASLRALAGEMSFSPDAQEALRTWNDSGCLPEPSHPRLFNYNTRRIVHVLKLCMIAACAKAIPSTMIELDDVQTALDWLLEAEADMPNVFLEMAGRSDTDTLRDLHHFAWTEYHRLGKKPLHESRFLYFLSTRVPAFQAKKIFETAIQAHMFKRVAGTTEMYIPQPRSSFGVV